MKNRYHGPKGIAELIPDLKGSVPFVVPYQATRNQRKAFPQEQSITTPLQVQGNGAKGKRTSYCLGRMVLFSMHSNIYNENTPFVAENT